MSHEFHDSDLRDLVGRAQRHEGMTETVKPHLHNGPLVNRLLVRGQRKSIQNQRVTLAPGDPKEVAVVRRMFRSFVQQKKSTKQIARP